MKITIMTLWCFVNTTLIWNLMRTEWNQQDRKKNQVMLVLTQYEDVPVVQWRWRFSRSLLRPRVWTKIPLQQKDHNTKSQDLLRKMKRDLQERKVIYHHHYREESTIQGLGRDTSRYLGGCLCTSMVQLQSIHFPAVSEENRWKRWTVSHVNVPVQDSFQHHGRVNSENQRITILSLLREFWRNNYAHVILTAEVDSLPTHTIPLLEDYGFVGCQSARCNYLSAHARINSTGYDRLLWESNFGEDKSSHAAIFEVKLHQTKSHVSEPRTHFPVSWNMLPRFLQKTTQKSNLKPTADCLRNTSERQLVTRSSLPRIRCCVCQEHHERDMNAPGSVRKFFKKILQQSYNYKVDMRQHTNTSRIRQALHWLLS